MAGSPASSTETTGSGAVQAPPETAGTSSDTTPRGVAPKRGAHIALAAVPTAARAAAMTDIVPKRAPGAPS
jgi:hypothetical protein